MIQTKRGVRSPHADEVDKLIRTTSMTNPEIAAKVGVTLGYIQNRRRHLKQRVRPISRATKLVDNFTAFDMLIKQVFR